MLESSLIGEGWVISSRAYLWRRDCVGEVREDGVTALYAVVKRGVGTEDGELGQRDVVAGPRRYACDARNASERTKESNVNHMRIQQGNVSI